MKSDFVLVKELVEEFENSDSKEIKDDAKNKLAKLSLIIDDMLCKCTDHYMPIAFKAMQIVKYNKISLKSP